MKIDSLCYFWSDGQVRTVCLDGATVINEEEFNHCYFVDMRFENETSRYGVFTPKWRHKPLSQFPAEFRTHLLLLGVS